MNQIPRQIPPAPKYLRPWVNALLLLCWSLLTLFIIHSPPQYSAVSSLSVSASGEGSLQCLTHINPGAAFVELYFVLSSLFASRAYYAFGFLALTAGVVGLTAATVTILFTYFILCAEEYRHAFFSKYLRLPLTAESVDGTGEPF